MAPRTLALCTLRAHSTGHRCPGPVSVALHCAPPLPLTSRLSPCHSSRQLAAPVYRPLPTGRRLCSPPTRCPKCGPTGQCRRPKVVAEKPGVESTVHHSGSRRPSADAVLNTPAYGLVRLPKTYRNRPVKPLKPHFYGPYLYGSCRTLLDPLQTVTFLCALLPSPPSIAR
ncbi:hypothetical protein DFH08DRAFT_875997 [Mycena albidolilacea]|uniref:Uncharacterized protein n=1 Tax=Mycena albidolilacea TaxID=1033008 RepID=A0AAD7ELV3_9AGAR|nr:hypothetical protein DFH08DRAFT_875997 [Mycena albidolilacea]